MIHVIATIDLAPGTRDSFLTELRKIIAEVRTEYGPAIDADTGIPAQFRIGEDRIAIMEKWDSVAALKAHAVAPHMQAYRVRVKDFVRGMELRVLAPA